MLLGAISCNAHDVSCMHRQLIMANVNMLAQWLLLAHAASASAFRVLSGECSSVPSREFLPFFVSDTHCVRSTNASSCRVEPPTSAGLLARSSAAAASLLVDGISYELSSEALLPVSQIIEIPVTNVVGALELCRLPVPEWQLRLAMAIVWLVIFPLAVFVFIVRSACAYWTLAGVANATAVTIFPWVAQIDGMALHEGGAMAGEYVWESWRLSVAFGTLIAILDAALIGIRLQVLRGRRQKVAFLNCEVIKRLRDGSIRLLSVEWLLVQEAGFVLPRRQELEKVEGALFEPEEAVRLLLGGRVAALSYRWLSRDHPDPNGFHTAMVVAYLRTHCEDRDRRLAIFWDYGSVHQKDEFGVRTPAEDAAFRSALSVMSDVYATPSTLVLQQKELPDGFPAHLPPYDRSGWCNMEQAAASIGVDGGGHLYKLGHGPVKVSARARRTPEQMAEIFADEERIVFIGKADRDLVAHIYEDLYNRIVKYEYATTNVLETAAGFVVLGFWGNNQTVLMLVGTLTSSLGAGLAIWGAARYLIVVLLTSLGWLILLLFYGPTSVVLRAYVNWALFIEREQQSKPSAAELSPRSGLWRGYTCGVYNGQDIRITLEGGGAPDTCWRVEHLRRRAWNWALCGVGEVRASRLERVGPSTFRLGSWPCTLQDARTISWPDGYFAGVDVSWRWDPEEMDTGLHRRSAQLPPADLISARQMSALWLYIAWIGPIPFPFIAVHIGSGEDTVWTLFDTSPMFFCFLGRRFVREPGTNTFFWHWNGVNMGFEDWVHFRSARAVSHGPGAPPSQQGDRVDGFVKGIMLFGGKDNRACQMLLCRDRDTARVSDALPPHPGHEPPSESS